MNQDLTRHGNGGNSPLRDSEKRNRYNLRSRGRDGSYHTCTACSNDASTRGSVDGESRVRCRNTQQPQNKMTSQNQIPLTAEKEPSGESSSEEEHSQALLPQLQPVKVQDMITASKLKSKFGKRDAVEPFRKKSRSERARQAPQCPRHGKTEE